jgi:hypothetical protein
MADGLIIEPASVAAGGVAPAGHVKTDADHVWHLLEVEADNCAERNEYFEGRDLTEAEVQFRRRVFGLVAAGANRHLASQGVELVWLQPEARGFGCRFTGKDQQGRQYQVDYRFNDEVRINAARIDSSAFVRETIIDIVEAVLAKRAEYLRRGGLPG